MKSRPKRRLAAVTALAIVSAMLVVAPPNPPASASQYLTGLCGPPAPNPLINGNRTWVAALRHGTNDYVNAANGYSFRTCPWNDGTRADVKYKCSYRAGDDPPDLPWLNNVVAAFDPQQRDQWTMTCNNTWRGKIANLTAGNVNTRYHAWAASDSTCGDPDCPWFLILEFKKVPA